MGIKRKCITSASRSFACRSFGQLKAAFHAFLVAPYANRYMQKENSTMYAVIFKAEINEIDKSYSAMANKMRDLAINEYGCIKFNSATEGNNEIAISYWNSKEQIKEWKQNKEHLKAQELGKTKWYKSYSVEIVEVISQYENI